MCVVVWGRGETRLGVKIHDPLRYLTPPEILEDNHQHQSVSPLETTTYLYMSTSFLLKTLRPWGLQQLLWEHLQGNPSMSTSHWTCRQNYS